MNGLKKKLKKAGGSSEPAKEEKVEAKLKWHEKWHAENVNVLQQKKFVQTCKSSDLTPDWNGVVLVVNPTDSKIADTLNIKQKGKYAIKVT